MKKNLRALILNAVALGMGVARIVLGILGTVPVQTNVMLLSIGLAALALNQLDKQDER
jgi:hypothetical protein